MELAKENLESFLMTIRLKYGYDFSGYSKNSFLRRMNRFMNIFQIPDLEMLSAKIMEDEFFFGKFLEEITVNITEMFRDPPFYRALRDKVLPELKTYPYARIWDAGCSTGEEPYSLSILLHEEGLKARSRIYATDINRKVVSQAAEGIFNIQDIIHYTTNYHLIEGKQAFSDYYHAKYNRAIIEDFIKKNIVFSVHNLATDGSFNEFNLIVCRNVLIYFDRQLQEKVFKLFFESLSMFGYLALGNKESLTLSNYSDCFEVVDRAQKIYRKIKE